MGSPRRGRGSRGRSRARRTRLAATTTSRGAAPARTAGTRTTSPRCTKSSRPSPRALAVLGAHRALGAASLPRSSSSSSLGSAFRLNRALVGLLVLLAFPLHSSSSRQLRLLVALGSLALGPRAFHPSSSSRSSSSSSSSSRATMGGCPWLSSTLKRTPLPKQSTTLHTWRAPLPSSPLTRTSKSGTTKCPRLLPLQWLQRLRAALASPFQPPLLRHLPPHPRRHP